MNELHFEWVFHVNYFYVSSFGFFGYGYDYILEAFRKVNDLLAIVSRILIVLNGKDARRIEPKPVLKSFFGLLSLSNVLG